jgi:hypothetical protein
MAKSPPNSRKKWTPKDDATLRKLAKQNTPTGLIAHELGRSKRAVYQHASAIDVTLKPTNQSPYNQLDRRAREVLDAMRAPFRGVSPEEIQQEADKAIVQVRARRRAEQVRAKDAAASA